MPRSPRANCPRVEWQARVLLAASRCIFAMPDLTTSDQKTLQTRIFYGKEKKSLAYVIAIMNMILANPPFGGKERKECSRTFPSRPARRRFCFCSTSSSP